MPGQVRAGKCDFVDPGVGGERGARGFAVARDDVDDTGRHAPIHRYSPSRNGVSGAWVMASVSRFLTTKLRVTVALLRFSPR